MKKCKNCGKSAEGKYCEECAALFYCEGCGSYSPDLTETVDGLRCPECMRHYRECIDCGEYTKDGRSRIFEGEIVFLCYECNGHRFALCDGCSEIDHVENMVEIDGYFYCEQHAPRNSFPTRCCGEEVVSDSFEELPSERRWGIEIETDRGMYKEVPDNWGIHYDGSIDGMEIVSPILQGDEGLRQVKYIYDNCDLGFDYKCGIHVHIDVSDLNVIQRTDLVKAFLNTKQVWFSYVSPERRDNEYCQDNLPEFKLDDDFISYYQKDMTRYSWLNLLAFSKHGTFEIRLLEGCDFEKVERWIKMLLKFVDEVVMMSVC